MDAVGRVLEIGRFPVKSMLGESPDSATLIATGVVGDRSHALVDEASGKVASAKDPRAWAHLLTFRARLAGDAGVLITLPDGGEVASTDPDADVVLSTAVGRDVHLRAEPATDAGYDYVWERDDLAPDEVIEGSRTGTTEEGRPVSSMPVGLMAPGTFQDVAPVTLMTTAALATMQSHHPEGDWSPARFRSTLLLEVEGDGIIENEWLGRRVEIGGAALEVAMAAPRCVMTTLAQPGLPRDPGILQAVAAHNRVELPGLGTWACLGVYATVATPGDVAVDDAVRLV